MCLAISLTVSQVVDVQCGTLQPQKLYSPKTYFPTHFPLKTHDYMGVYVQHQREFLGVHEVAVKKNRTSVRLMCLRERLANGDRFDVQDEEDTNSARCHL